MGTVPDIPPEVHVAYQKAFWDRMKSFGYGYSDPVWHSLNAALAAVAPMFAEACAAKILEHAERQHPRDPDHVPTAWHRHFSIAARVAAGAFDTREDQLRMAAQAIERGDFAWCPSPENASSSSAATGEDGEP